MAHSSMLDLSVIQDTAPDLEFPAVLDRFLQQFDQMDDLFWVDGHWSRMLLVCAVKLQRDILQALDQTTITDLSSQTTVIALARLSFRLLDSHDAQHWPTVLHVLAIPKSTRETLHIDDQLLAPVREAAYSLDPLLNDLTRYFYVCTKGGIIMSHRWVERSYAEQISHCPVALEAARKIHDIWVLDVDDITTFQSPEVVDRSGFVQNDFIPV
ncbi:uncharacterized protein DSM5745_10488 [Aspergillus mulundensis]|uniref:Uncharacterized protein n=1 Tax=Aspergillus mulundensis TaxID=1810919 RepID=A0A3D8QJ16_9EURO|nr:hypothetical protein DSM5745_10488 [Aspergillus mulundensis]RDW61816.1 hypothetical protein DSM5745_10488 [Aspergillus mulundensis]